MTPEQFIWWLEGFLDGGADINMDVRDQLREKLEQVGAPPAQKQSVADRPRTPRSALEDRYLTGVGVGVATPGAAAPMGGRHTGGFVGSHTVGIVDPSFTTLTNSAALTSANAALTSATACVNAETRA